MSELKALDTLPVVALHPAIIDEYRRKIAALAEADANSDPKSDVTVAVLRGLIDRVAAVRGPQARGVAIELQGSLANIISMATGQPIPQSCMFVAERVKGIEPSS